MLANDMKKGQTGMLKNGWAFRIEDNKKGIIRMATVFGHCTEMGSVYISDIAWVCPSESSLADRGLPFTTWEEIEFSPQQAKQISRVRSWEARSYLCELGGSRRQAYGRNYTEVSNA